MKLANMASRIHSADEESDTLMYLFSNILPVVWGTFSIRMYLIIVRWYCILMLFNFVLRNPAALNIANTSDTWKPSATHLHPHHVTSVLGFAGYNTYPSFLRECTTLVSHCSIITVTGLSWQLDQVNRMQESIHTLIQQEKSETGRVFWDVSNPIRASENERRPCVVYNCCSRSPSPI